MVKLVEYTYTKNYLEETGLKALWEHVNLKCDECKEYITKKIAKYHGYSYNDAPDGIYLFDANGLLWDIDCDEYVGRTPIGVAILSGIRKYVISLNNVKDSDGNDLKCEWGGYGTLIDNVSTIESTTPYSDYNGESNTTNIISQLGTGNAPAAENAQNYEIKIRDYYLIPIDYKWYLGSSGEWQLMMDHLDEVNAIITKFGGDIFTTNDAFWTSTQYDMGRNIDTEDGHYYAASASIYNTYIGGGRKNNTNGKIRPFLNIKATFERSLKLE